MAQAIPLVLAVAGTALSAGGSIIGSQAEGRELNLQATQLQQQAGQERAASQRKAMEERRQARLVASRAQAIAGASGAGASDTDVLDTIADIEGEGAYRAMSALYDGDQAAINLEEEANARRRAAKSTKTAGLLKAGGSILSAGASLYDRYG